MWQPSSQAERHGLGLRRGTWRAVAAFLLVAGAFAGIKCYGADQGLAPMSSRLDPHMTRCAWSNTGGQTQQYDRIQHAAAGLHLHPRMNARIRAGMQASRSALNYHMYEFWQRSGMDIQTCRRSVTWRLVCGCLLFGTPSVTPRYQS